jgi:hypothetical protein
MTLQEKLVFQAAELIRDQYWRLHQGPATVTLPAEYWAKAQTLVGQIERIAQRGWQGAVVQLRRDLELELEYCRDRLDRVINILQTPLPPVPSLADLYQEISSLSQEFENWQIDIKNHELAVTTEPIVLEGIRLGAFEIRLDWDQLGEASLYRVVALDPNPAASSSSVTHPHVQNERLCEGDGRVGIQSALKEGRFTDFFLIVAQLLRTYARGSAFVELDDWEGVLCDDCGESVYSDERFCCNHCDAAICEHCARSCCWCDSTFCSNCLISCVVCNDDYCSLCIDRCKICHQNVCKNCQINGVCEECHAKRNPPTDLNEPSGDQSDKDPGQSAAETCNTSEPLGIGV